MAESSESISANSTHEKLMPQVGSSQESANLLVTPQGLLMLALLLVPMGSGLRFEFPRDPSDVFATVLMLAGGLLMESST